jgi:hypothetical protein
MRPDMTRYELISGLVSEWFFTTITVHIGLISEMHTPNLDRKSEKQRKKPIGIGSNDFHMKRFILGLILESLFACIFDMNPYVRSIGFILKEKIRRMFPIDDGGGNPRARESV